MSVKEYMRIAETTDKLEPKEATNPNYKVVPVLGLAGEIGSLLAELKKRVRERHRASDLGTKLIREELGDIIWYAATIARRAGLDFQKDILLANLRRVGTLIDYLPSSEKITLQIDTAVPSIAEVETFDSYQRNASRSATPQHDPDILVPYLSRIWRNSGELLDHLDVSQSSFSEEEKQRITQPLGDVMWYVARFATLFNESLGNIASLNAEKTQSMFVPGAPTPLHDEDDKLLEQFPRKFDVDFVPTDSETAVMLINGLQIGDPLKDNADPTENATPHVIDGYRFHDCVHLAFVAVLGWSPVLRDLMKRKRKSKKKVDDAQDGARARIVEEMIVKLTHSYAVGVDPERLLGGRTHVTMDLLKQIQTLTEKLDVNKNKFWEWEKAILEGYRIFDQLRRCGRGRIRVDLRSRSVSFSELADGEAEKFRKPT